MKTVKPLCGDFLPLSEIHWELLCAVLLIWKQLNPIMVTRSFCPHGIALLADYWRTFLQYILQPLFTSIMATIYCRTTLYHKHSIYHEMLPLHVHSEVWVCKLRHKKKPKVFLEKVALGQLRRVEWMLKVENGGVWKHIVARRAGFWAVNGCRLNAFRGDQMFLSMAPGPVLLKLSFGPLIVFFPRKPKLSHWYCGWHLEDKILFKAAKWAFLKIRLFLVLVVVCPLFHQQRYCFPHICQQWPLRCLFLSDAFTTTARGVFGGQVSVEVVEALTWWREKLVCRLASGRGNSFK